MSGELSQSPAPSDPFAGQPVERVQRDGVSYTLLGTAHVSRKSAETVAAALAGGDYDAVAVELCASRHQALTNPDAWRDMDLIKIIREGKAGLVAASLALGAYQRRLAEQFGIEPGAEMRAALEGAERRQLPYLLIDRDIGVTLKRVFRAVKFWEKMSIFSGLIASLFSREQISEEEIEKLKQGDMLENTFAEFAAQSESLYDSLISERDRYMAAALRQKALDHDATRVLAVVGAGHLKGLTRDLATDDADPRAVRHELDRIPPRRRWSRWLPWLITAVILAGFAIGFARSPELGWQLVATWVVINGTLAALGALIAGGHPLTVASGFVAAPLTSLNPTIAAGMVTASVETALRKPKVADFATLRDDVLKLSGWWKNRVSRILLVLILSNLGSIAGTWIAGFQIFEKLT